MVASVVAGSGEGSAGATAGPHPKGSRQQLTAQGGRVVISRWAKPRQTCRPGDLDDMLAPRWQVPGPPAHPHLAALERGLNRAMMRPLLNLGRHAMGAGLRLSGFHRGVVATRLGQVNVFHARGAGTLPPLYLVLGIGGTTTDYLPMLRRCLPHFSHVTAIDLPSHGYSEKIRDTRRICDATVVGAMQDGLDQVVAQYGRGILLGHSLGGYLAARYAQMRPERVRGLVLCEPLGAPFDTKQRESFVKLYALETRRKARTVIHNAFYNDDRDNAFITAAAWARLTGRISRAMIRSDLFTNALRPEALGGLEPPVLLVWGQDDHLLPESHLSYFLDHLPINTTVTMPPKVNHNNTAMGPPQVLHPVVHWSKLLA